MHKPNAKELRDAIATIRNSDAAPLGTMNLDVIAGLLMMLIENTPEGGVHSAATTGSSTPLPTGLAQEKTLELVRLSVEQVSASSKTIADNTKPSTLPNTNAQEKTLELVRGLVAQVLTASNAVVTNTSDQEATLELLRLLLDQILTASKSIADNTKGSIGSAQDKTLELVRLAVDQILVANKTIADNTKPSTLPNTNAQEKTLELVRILLDQILTLNRTIADNTRTSAQLPATLVDGKLAVEVSKSFALDATVAAVRDRFPLELEGGRLKVVAPAVAPPALPTTGISGRKSITLANTFEPLTASTKLIKGVTVQAGRTNAGFVTVRIGAAGDGVILEKNQTVFVEIDDPNKLQVSVSALGEIVRWIGT